MPVFTECADDELDWFLEQSSERRLAPGEVYFSPGSTADHMFVFIEGEAQARDASKPDLPVFTMSAGGVTGKLPFSRMTKITLTGRAVTPVRLLEFPAAKFPELFQRIPQLFERLVGVMSDRIREFTRLEQQRDRLAALGKLSAGLAHELNNPAAAASRATESMRDSIAKYRDAVYGLASAQLSPTQSQALDTFESSLLRPEQPMDALAASDLEQEIEKALAGKGIDDGWKFSAPLIERGVNIRELNQLLDTLTLNSFRPALQRIVSFIEVDNLLSELETSTSKISTLVKAVKEYSYMDQAPVQDVDIRKAIENTLTIMGYKLNKGVTVKREYYPEILRVNSYGSELNQVWTNIIDNAIDAMNGKGELTIRTLPEGGCVLVEIGDNGPGMTAEVKAHIFEPFYTTKGVGEGTGLGLDTVMRIVRKHRGSIDVQSSPRGTRFQIRLPVSSQPLPSSE